MCLEDFSTQDNTQISCHNCSYNYPFGAIGDGSLFPRFDADNSSFDGRPPPPPPTESSSLEDSFLSEERSLSDEGSDSEASHLRKVACRLKARPFTAGDASSSIRGPSSSSDTSDDYDDSNDVADRTFDNIVDMGINMVSNEDSTEGSGDDGSEDSDEDCSEQSKERSDDNNDDGANNEQSNTIGTRIAMMTTREALARN